MGAIALRGFGTAVDRIDKADDANRLIKYAQGLRIHEKNDMLRGHETALIELERTIETIDDLIRDLEGRFQSEEHLAQLDAIRKSAERYKIAFDAWVDASKEVYGSSRSTVPFNTVGSTPRLG